MATNRRKGGKSRRNDELKFAYAGPFAPLLDPIRVLPRTTDRYTPDSPESYTVGSQIPGPIRLALTVDVDAERKPRKRRRRRGGGRRDAA